MRLNILAVALAISPATAGYSVINDTPKLSVFPDWLYSRMLAAKGWQPSAALTEECKLSFSSPEVEPSHCEAHYDLSFWETFLSKLYVSFDVTDQTKFKRIEFEPQLGLKIRGLLGLQVEKGQVQKKPLVIIRMGIFGNIDEFFSERYLARIVYQDLNYHFLVLESLTSHGHLTLNENFSIGGIEEGLHTFYILNLIKHQQVDWAKEVSDIYLQGISLGGPGVFVANYLDENSLINGQKKKSEVKAIELFCPVINFEETFKVYNKPGIFPAAADLWNRTRLQALRTRDKTLDDIPWWKTILDLTPRFMPQALSELNLKRGQPIFNLDNFKQFKNLSLPQEFIDHVKKSKTLYELNSFWSFYKNQETPIHIYLTPNDPLVMNELNGELIRTHKQPGIFNKVRFTDLNGTHCALAAEYQWPYLVDLVRRGFEDK